MYTIQALYYDPRPYYDEEYERQMKNTDGLPNCSLLDWQY